jgi:hypothetical protein
MGEAKVSSDSKEEAIGSLASPSRYMQPKSLSKGKQGLVDTKSRSRDWQPRLLNLM